MEWDNEKTLQFIELYEKYPVIWNAEHVHHKNRMKVNDAWVRLQQQFDETIPIAELKKKKESLMSSYRPLRRKVVESQRTGSSSEDLFKPSWYAYDAIDRIMSVKREKNISSINSKDGWSPELESDEGTESNEISHLNNYLSVNSDNSQTETEHFLSQREGCQPQTRKKRRVSSVQAEVKLAGSLRQASNALNLLTTRESKQAADQCTIFGQLVAEQLRQLSPRKRILTQTVINNALTEALLEEIESSNTMLHCY